LSRNQSHFTLQSKKRECFMLNSNKVWPSDWFLNDPVACYSTSPGHVHVMNAACPSEPDSGSSIFLGLTMHGRTKAPSDDPPFSYSGEGPRPPETTADRPPPNESHVYVPSAPCSKRKRSGGKSVSGSGYMSGLVASNRFDRTGARLPTPARGQSRLSADLHRPLSGQPGRPTESTVPLLKSPSLTPSIAELKLIVTPFGISRSSAP